MQSKYFALKNLITTVYNGMNLVGTPIERFDEIMDSTIKALKRHRKESEYAETELIHIGRSIRYAKTPYLDGAIIFLTRNDNRYHQTLELLDDIENTLYFPRHIIEQF